MLAPLNLGVLFVQRGLKGILDETHALIHVVNVVVQLRLPYGAVLIVGEVALPSVGIAVLLCGGGGATKLELLLDAGRGLLRSLSSVLAGAAFVEVGGAPSFSVNGVELSTAAVFANDLAGDSLR